MGYQDIHIIISFLIVGILFWPLWGSICSGLFGKFLGRYYASRVAVVSLFLCCFCSIYLSYYCLFNNLVLSLPLGVCFDIIFSDIHYNVTWGLFFDNLSITIAVVISSISALVHIYTLNYFDTDPHITRFYGSLSLFTFFILVLVTAANFFQIFVGWEGVGICSYLLIGFWYQRQNAVKSAIQALVVNKVGDFTLVVAIVLLLFLFGTTDIHS